MALAKQDIRQLKDALHAAELDGVSFGLARDTITLADGQVFNAEAYVRKQVKNVLRPAVAAPLIAVLERHGWNGEY